MPHEVSAATQVLIVGARPTGLAAANLLGLHGIGTTVIECDATTSDLVPAMVQLLRESKAHREPFDCDAGVTASGTGRRS
ncbi:MAG: hypothetical protein FI707_10890 [SAR202 cluster bacterium]|jgi:2-polyprenyl-6-methoxyphenol hydroxylase-like FAD-dependent oxidoreductase|nr:hypothetical protein [Acidobacteriota bacterium]MBU81861.1 hypothetical protein [Chloroflexota bacterium]MDP6800056.1 FAD-dependent monooxygenase [SAR202 cluster bacterium]MQG58448.1 hypothetical protein [SAR202 cluster bacterium]MQG69282.1 hypothetical protein [SAR202 cluster bacterium]|tara:strand:- start:295 stop:534 length:240 start_codon:yes stop_codon:yes gene_type:complete